MEEQARPPGRPAASATLQGSAHPGGAASTATAAALSFSFCAASRFFSSCFGIVSTFSVALISLDRYCAIVRPPRDKLGRRRALQLLAGAWLAALGFSLPWDLLRAPREPPAPQSFHRCLYRTSPDPAQLGVAYSVGLVVACYLLPFLLMCFCRYHICKTVLTTVLNREEGYRTRNMDAFLPSQGLGFQARSRNRLRNGCANRLGACSRMPSSNPASGSGGEVVMWARKNPVVLFFREGPPDSVMEVGKLHNSETRDSSI